MRSQALSWPVAAILLATLPGLLHCTWTQAAEDGAGAEVNEQGLSRLRNYLDNFQSMRAEFRQEVINRDLELIERASGTVVLQKPGRFVWHYDQPYERVIMADGKKVWLYEADLEQVTVRPLDAGLGETPASLLTGTADVLDHFEYVDTSIVDDLEWIQIKPRSPESDFASIILAFDGDMLVQIALLDRLDQRTRLYLSNIERPAKLAADEFVFDVPDGVDVIGETEF